MDFLSRKSKFLKKEQRKKLRFISLDQTIPSIPTVIFISLIITVFSLIYLWQWTQYMKEGFKVQTLEKEQRRLKKRIELLEIETVYLTRHERLNELAKKMKLTPPKLEQRIPLKRQ